jgi:hypothetical protein
MTPTARLATASRASWSRPEIDDGVAAHRTLDADAPARASSIPPARARAPTATIGPKNDEWRDGHGEAGEAARARRATA